MIEPLLYTAKRVAELVGVSRQTIVNWTAYGLPCYAIGRKGKRQHKRFKLEDVKAFIARCRVNSRMTNY